MPREAAGLFPSRIAGGGLWLAIAFLTATAPSYAQTSDDAAPDRWHLDRSGLGPLSETPPAGVQTRRISGHVYLVIMPSVELQRTADGHVTLTLFYLGNRRTAPIDAARWDELKAMSTTSLAPYDARERRLIDRHLHRFRNTSCHGAYAVIEAQFDNATARRHVHSCAGPGTARPFRYADAIARTALEALPECLELAKSDEPLANLSRCAGLFGWKVTPEYRELELRYHSRQR